MDIRQGLPAAAGTKSRSSLKTVCNWLCAGVPGETRRMKEEIDIRMNLIPMALCDYHDFFQRQMHRFQN